MLHGATDEAEISRRLTQMGAAHPRIFLKQGAEQSLNESLKSDPARARLRSALLAQADSMLATKPVERVLIGRRLLDKSRTCLSRVLHLGLAWRLTGERKYAERARQEMLAAAAFSDWNPSHFLDVAEMTAALGTGYDWLYAFLDEDSLRTIRQAIGEKGLKPSLTVNGWSKAIHNWNQVCNAGMAIGALAVAESEPQLAAQMIARAINTVPAAMHEYGPDGAYPEGASYWSYGTTFNVMLIAAIESALGSDFGLTRTPGFGATADYMLHVYGPTGLPFNYSDAGSGRAGLIPAMFWFTSVRQAPYLLWSEWAKLAGGDNPFDGDRLDPLLLLWLPKGSSRPSTPQALSWTGHGTTPVAFHRSSWDPSATYIAIKGGSPSSNHAHMDAGAFVMDAAGTRWADDLGMQSYHSLESRGVDLWSRGQEAGRWKVFRLGTAAHSVLMVNGQQQRVEGMARITASKPGRTVVDVSETYRGQLGQARRGVQMRADRTVLVQDEFTGLGPERASVRWAMLTRADVRVDGPGRATLTRDGRTLEFRVVEPAGAVIRIYATDPPPAETDAPNPGTRMLGFEIDAPAGAARRVVVHLVPQTAAASAVAVQPLSEW
ncbi:MAG: heparinase II/III family protein [Bryobacteraceae bacterium]|nr:heparinase II/III family protein [Bryobacteraceae bacterium]